MQRIICQGCRQEIRGGSYINALGANWHPEHFVCAACHQPFSTSGYLLHEGRPYHRNCYTRAFAPRCAYCQKPLEGEHRINYWGQKYCKEHEDQLIRCAFCNRIVPLAEQERGVERTRCAVCRSTAIETAEEAAPLFKELVQWVGQQGLRYNNLRIHLELCGQAKLASYHQGQSGIHALGTTQATRYEQNGRIVRSEVEIVSILQGLPKELFQGVTVHELGHVWLAVQGVYHLPPWAEEGFCELLAYRYYREKNTPEAQYHIYAMEHSQDAIYGAGFRRMRELTERTAFSSLIETLAIKKRLPS